jgi:hypothetical protein
MVRKKNTADSHNDVGISVAIVSSGNLINLSAVHNFTLVSKRVAVTAMRSVSVFAVTAVLLAAETLPAVAQSTCLQQSSNNVTGYCAGPILPSSGFFSNSGTISGGSTGVSIGSGIKIYQFTNSGTVNASAASEDAFGIYNSGIINTLTNSGTINASASSSGYAYGIHSSGSINTLINRGSINASASLSWKA